MDHWHRRMDCEQVTGKSYVNESGETTGSKRRGVLRGLGRAGGHCVEHLLLVASASMIRHGSRRRKIAGVVDVILARETDRSAHRRQETLDDTGDIDGCFPSCVPVGTSVFGGGQEIDLAEGRVYSEDERILEGLVFEDVGLLQSRDMWSRGISTILTDPKKQEDLQGIVRAPHKRPRHTRWPCLQGSP